MLFAAGQARALADGEELVERMVVVDSRSKEVLAMMVVDSGNEEDLVEMAVDKLTDEALLVAPVDSRIDVLVVNEEATLVTDGVLEIDEFAVAGKDTLEAFDGRPMEEVVDSRLIDAAVRRKPVLCAEVALSVKVEFGGEGKIADEGVGKAELGAEVTRKPVLEGTSVDGEATSSVVVKTAVDSRIDELWIVDEDERLDDISVANEEVPSSVVVEATVDSRIVELSMVDEEVPSTVKVEVGTDSRSDEVSVMNEEALSYVEVESEERIPDDGAGKSDKEADVRTEFALSVEAAFALSVEAALTVKEESLVGSGMEELSAGTEKVSMSVKVDVKTTVDGRSEESSAVDEETASSMEVVKVEVSLDNTTGKVSVVNEEVLSYVEVASEERPPDVDSGKSDEDVEVRRKSVLWAEAKETR